MGTEQKKIAAQNKKALSTLLFVLDRYEAGIELCGTEVKSIRQNDSISGLMVLDGRQRAVRQRNAHPAHEHGNLSAFDPLRVRRLLMHKREIMCLLGQTKQEGLTLVPLSVYFVKGRAKVEVGLCKGKRKLYDSAQTAAKERRRAQY